MKKVTIQEVAKELNLSRNTVARALNNSETVAYETRYMVIEKAYEMGYSKLSPTLLHEFKLKNRTVEQKTIVVLVRRELSVFWNSIILGISDEANKNNCKLRISFVGLEEEERLQLPDDLTEKVDAIIVMSVFSTEYLRLLVRKELPMIFLDGPVEYGETLRYGDILMYEGYRCIKDITEKLIEQGRRRLAFIGDISYCKTIAERFQGFCGALFLAGIPLDERLNAIAAEKQRYYDADVIRSVVEGWPYLPDAVVCANDYIAMLLIKCLRSKGISVPRDIAVTGFDNEEEIAAQLNPFLTTVKVHNQCMGQRLVQQLLWRMQHQSFPSEMIVVSGEIMLRESTNYGLPMAAGIEKLSEVYYERKLHEAKA